MTFVSYAQNFEDVMLWRALKHVKSGFYIDIGAAWPDEHSVTKCFYDRGWAGINVEPNPIFYEDLQLHRSRDMNLLFAVTDCEASAVMNFMGDTGLSTLNDEIAERHRQSGWEVERQEVQVTTLAKLWSTYVPSGQDVHFLKIDVEGMEEAVLRGNNWTKNRPWLIVIEATLPLSQMPSHTNWEPVLISADYRLAYADGLNLFYVASEHSELLPSFAYPPNVFDSFVLLSQQQAEFRAKQLDARAKHAESNADYAEAKAKHAEARAQHAEAALAAIYQSRSWRFTRPLRSLSLLLQRTISEITYWPNYIGKSILAGTMRFVLARPFLARNALFFLKRLPHLEGQLRTFAQGAAVVVRPDYGIDLKNLVWPTDVSHLSARAREIHNELVAALDRYQEENV